MVAMRTPLRCASLLLPLGSLAILAGAAMLGVMGGCSDSMTVNFGPPEGLKGAQLEPPTPVDGGIPPPVTDSGPPPPPPGDSGGGGGGDGGCAVSWSSTIYAFMSTKYTCTSNSGCHGPGSVIQNAPVMTNDAIGTYNVLKAYTLVGADGQPHPYILPGSNDPTKSSIECNLTPTGTKCGAIPMPSGQIMAAADFQAIDTWVRVCGAPMN
jgi:hypothetical protein